MANIITAVFGGNSRYCTTRPVFQIDKGDVLKFVGLNLPEYYEVHFSNSKNALAKRVLASGDSVVIPWEFMRHGQKEVFAWVYITPDAQTGYTPYQVTIPLNLRSDISESQPTPAQEDIVDEAIAALNEGVTRAEDAADKAEEATERYPRIVNGYWHVWDVDTQQWTDTGVKAVGEDGPAGPKGDKGDTGDTGATGPAGKSAYESAQDGGYSGTEAQFETDLAGVSGKQSRITASGLLKGDGQGGVSAAVAGTDYPSPEQYSDQGIVLLEDKQAPITPYGNNIIILNDSAHGFQAEIDPSQGLSLIMGAIPVVGAGSADLLVGCTGNYQAAYSTILPNLSPLIDPETRIGRSRIKGVGAIGVGSAVCPEADGAAAFGALQWVKKKYGFAAGGYNYVNGQYACAIGRYLETNTYCQAVFGTCNDPKAEDLFEVGNGEPSNTAISRSNAFRVTNSGKAIAQTALAIDDGNGGLIELTREQLQAVINAVTVTTVEGATPTITALPGVRYVCGEVTTLDITLPASGIVDVTFESGSTATVLTITPPTGVTLKWANGFDPTSLDVNTTYEINIMDGLGVAASWT